MSQRYYAKADKGGDWGVADAETYGLLLGGVRFKDRQKAEELADRYNAIHEGEDAEFVEQLRDDFHREDTA